MVKTVGERAKQEADAFKGRGWFRDMLYEVFGLGEYRHTDGTLHRMRYEQRDKRIDRASDAFTKAGWIQIDMMAIMCATTLQRFEQDIHAMLELLKLQTPDIFTWFDDASPIKGAYASADIPQGTLGTFRTANLWDDMPDIAKNSFPSFPDNN